MGFLGLQAKSTLLHWLPLFAMGMVAFHVQVGYLSLWRGLALHVVLASLCSAIIGIPETVVGIATTVTIMLCGSMTLPRWTYAFSLLGTISYSLYLIHVPIGGRAINVAERLNLSLYGRYAAIAGALIVSVAASALFWRLIEQTAQRWAKGKTDNQSTGCEFSLETGHTA